VAGGLAAADLQRQVAQCIGGQQRLIGRGGRGRIGNGGLAVTDHRLRGEFVETRPWLCKVLNAIAKIGI
jgi:hypothetical protein